MKRIVAAFGVFAFIGFIIGKLTGRPQTTGVARSAVEPTVIYVKPPQQDDKPLEGKLQKQRQWIATYRDILDPALVVSVALVAAVATGYFAWQTNAINNDQRQLMERQVNIQTSQSLPIFDLSLTHGFNEEGEAISEYVVITNMGGMARSIDIDARASVEVRWAGFDNDCGSYETLDGLSRMEMPLLEFTEQDLREPDDPNIFYDSLAPLPENLNNGESLSLGHNSNLWNLNNAFNLIYSRMLYDYGEAYDFLSILWYFRIIYDDYQGISRTEYYVAESAYHYWHYFGSYAPDPGMLELYETYGIGRDRGESWYRTSDEMIDAGLYIENGEHWNEERESVFFPLLKSEMAARVDTQAEHYPSDWPLSELEACEPHPRPTPTPDG